MATNEQRTTSKQHKQQRKSGKNKTGYKDKSRDRRDKSDDSKYDYSTPGSNDFAWHAPENDLALLERASQVSWSWQTGEPVRMHDVYAQLPDAEYYQPGICVVRDLITCGPVGRIPNTWLDTNNLPSYTASINLMAEMRSRARVRNTYDAPDVFMLMMAMANIYAGVILAKRLAATCRMFTYQNEYLPRTLMEIQGFDAEWFERNQFTFVTQLNVLISEVNKVYIPNRMHIFELINERFSNYYTEGDSIRDQIYLFTPAFLSKIELNPNTNYASWLRPLMVIPGTVTGTTPSTWTTAYNNNARYTGTQLLDGIREMLYSVLELGSTADITGDLSNAFGPTERFILPDCDPTVIAMPIFNLEILETIHNAVPSIATTYAFQSYDSTGGVPDEFTTVQRVADNRIGMYDMFTVPSATISPNIFYAETAIRMIDVHSDPDSHKTFAATRLHNQPYYIDTTTSSSNTYVTLRFGADLVCSIEYYTFKYNSGTGQRTLTPIFRRAVETSAQYASSLMTSAFHYRNFTYFLNTAATAWDSAMSWPNGESDIYAEVANSERYIMDRISLLSLLGAYNNLK